MLALSLSGAAPCVAGPPLTEGQRRTLESTTTDGEGGLDAPGLYVLLRHAVAWDGGDERGAAIPEYDAIYANPGAYRGEAMLIEGRLLRARRRGVDRPGPWGSAVTEWVVAVSIDPVDVATLWMPDPEGVAAAIPPGRAVRRPARFYRVWQTTNTGTAGGEGRFLVFVGPAPDPGEAPSASAATWLGTLAVFAGVVALLIVVLWLRGMSRSASRRRGPLRHRLGDPDETEDDTAAVAREDEPVDALPTDPAEALRAMADRDDA